MDASVPATTPPPRKSWIGQCLAILGIACLLAAGAASIFTIARTWFLMILDTLHDTIHQDPHAFDSVIKEAVFIFTLAIPVSLLGLICVGIATLGCRFRPPWLHKALMAISALYVLILPLGTVLGILSIILLRFTRSAFTPRNIES